MTQSLQPTSSQESASQAARSDLTKVKEEPDSSDEEIDEFMRERAEMFKDKPEIFDPDSETLDWLSIQKEKQPDKRKKMHAAARADYARADQGT